MVPLIPDPWFPAPAPSPWTVLSANLGMSLCNTYWQILNTWNIWPLTACYQIGFKIPLTKVRSCLTHARKKDCKPKLSINSQSPFKCKLLRANHTHAYNINKVLQYKIKSYPGLLADGRLYFLTALSVWWMKNISCIENIHRDRQTDRRLSSEVASSSCCCLFYLDLKNTICATSYRSHASPRMLPVAFSTSNWLQCLWIINEYRCFPEAMLVFTLMQDIDWSAMHPFHA